jgi:hypothetical protein
MRWGIKTFFSHLKKLAYQFQAPNNHTRLPVDGNGIRIILVCLQAVIVVLAGYWQVKIGKT